jgi:hypothetical protein
MELQRSARALGGVWPLSKSRLVSLTLVVAGTFAVISAAGLLLSWLYAPTASAAGHIAFEGAMLAVTGATVAGVVVICCRRS